MLLIVKEIVVLEPAAIEVEPKLFIAEGGDKATTERVAEFPVVDAVLAEITENVGFTNTPDALEEPSIAAV